MLVPAIATALAGFILISFSVIQISVASEEEIQKEIAKIEELEIGLFEDMTTEEFKSFLIGSSIFGLIFILPFNFGLGLAGGFVGKTIGSRK